jgi:hypothetical protein
MTDNQRDLSLFGYLCNLFKYEKVLLRHAAISYLVHQTYNT